MKKRVILVSLLTLLFWLVLLAEYFQYHLIGEYVGKAASPLEDIVAQLRAKNLPVSTSLGVSILSSIPMIMGVLAFYALLVLVFTVWRAKRKGEFQDRTLAVFLLNMVVLLFVVVALKYYVAWSVTKPVREGEFIKIK